MAVSYFDRSIVKGAYTPYVLARACYPVRWIHMTTNMRARAFMAVSDSKLVLSPTGSARSDA